MAFPLDIKFVRDAEAKLGRSLPSSYIAQMCRCNGGTVSTIAGGDGRDIFYLHPIFDTTDRKRLSRTCNDIIRVTERSKMYSPDIFPPDAVEIADNGGGDLLILLPGPDGTSFDDGVFRWDHENGDIHRIADDFSELMHTG